MAVCQQTRKFKLRASLQRFSFWGFENLFFTSPCPNLSPTRLNRNSHITKFVHTKKGKRLNYVMLVNSITWHVNVMLERLQIKVNGSGSIFFCAWTTSWKKKNHERNKKQGRAKVHVHFIIYGHCGWHHLITHKIYYKKQML